MAPDLERLLLRFLFLTADVGDHVVHALRPGGERLAGAGNGLIGAGQHLRHTQVQQRVNGRHITLQRAVRFHRNEAALRAEALALRFDDSGVIGVDLRDDHRHVGRAAVGAVVAHHRAFRLGIRFLQRFDLLFFHVDGAEHKVAQGSDLFHILRSVVDHHVGHGCRHGGGHQPVIAHGFAVRFACGAGAGRQGSHMEPGVVFQQRGKSLANHAGCADDAYLVCFHFRTPPVLFVSEYVNFPIPVRNSRGETVLGIKKPVENRPPIYYNKYAIQGSRTEGRSG